MYFFRSLNSVYQKCCHANRETVVLQVVNSFCKPHLLYATECLQLSHTAITKLKSAWLQLQLQLQSFILKQLFSEESCSVVSLSEKMSFQLRSELSATVERWAEVRWKCVPDDRSRDGETSLADGRVCFVCALSKIFRVKGNDVDFISDMCERYCFETEVANRQDRFCRKLAINQSIKVFL